jgi:hypothetical protein
MDGIHLGTLVEALPQITLRPPTIARRQVLPIRGRIYRHFSSFHFQNDYCISFRFQKFQEITISASVRFQKGSQTFPEIPD